VWVDILARVNQHLHLLMLQNFINKTPQMQKVYKREKEK
jgi:hypothetical protein